MADMKIINDSVHFPIELGPVHLAFIDTPAFQRLRNILQMGAASWVYPTACHHRFEHCLGTCNLAGRLVRQIQRSRPELEISDQDILCAEIAGLLHDIGHGPFSHCWDRAIMSSLKLKYKHEKASIEIIDWLLRNDIALKAALDHAGFDHVCIRVVKEMIYGVLPGNDEKYYPPHNPKSFLYDVVSNDVCGLDVDKLDYVARDGRALGTVTLAVGDLEQLMLTASVENRGKGYHIYWRDNAASSLNNVFQLRHRLHFIVCQHKTVVGIEIMLKEVIYEARDYFKLLELYKKTGPNELQLNVNEFLKLTDAFFWQILYSTDGELEKSRTILKRIATRRIYPALSSIRFEGDDVQKFRKTDEDIEEELKELIAKENMDQGLKERCKNALIVTRCKFDYGMGNENPLDVILFRSHSGNVVERPENIYASYMFYPRHNQELHLRLYSRESKKSSNSGGDDECNKKLKEIFSNWADEKGMKSMNF